MIKIYTPKNIFVFFASALIVAAIFTGCKKSNIDVPYVNPPDLTTLVRSSVSGFVTDENNAAVNLATVQVGTTTVSTDKYGYFEVNNVDVVKTAAVVTISKAGYFKGIKTYIAVEDKAAFFRIKLIKKTNAGTVNASTGGSITLTNGLSISLPANAVVNAVTNAAYSGTVNVIAYWLDPTASDLSSTMPGDLRGLNTAGDMQLLTTYGMAAVELTGSGGEALQIANGKKASLTLPIPASILASAPASIPLWYFDEVKGLWKQEGSATRSGNKYTGEVSHFSFWNCDIPENFVQLSATIVNNSNQPVPNAVIKISVVGNPANCRYGYTNASGNVSGPVPANTQLLLEVYTGAGCTTLLHTQNVSTGNTNLTLETIAITLPNNLATISGTIVNCSNTPVTNGYVMVLNGTNYTQLSLSNTGSYSGLLLLCNNTTTQITLVADDLTTSMTSGPLIRNIVPGANTIAPIQVCGTPLQEYGNLTKNGVLKTYNYLFLSQATNTSYGVFFYADPARTIFGGHLQFNQTGIGVGSQQELISISSGGGSNMIITNPPVYVTITEYGAPGQYIAGNLSGTFLQPPSNTSYSISCNFRIKRTF